MDFSNPDGMKDLYQSVYLSEEAVDEATLSAKAARSGKDIGKPGKQFAKIASSAAKRYGSKERGEKVAGAVLAKMRAKAAHEEIDLYDTVLEFLYVEGYADTLEEAEWIMANQLTFEDVEEILEGKKDPNFQKMRKQEDRHMKKAIGYGGSRGSKNRAFKMSSIRGALERGEDPRADTYGGKRAERGNPPLDHRASYARKNPFNNPPRRVKKPGV